RKRSRRRRPSLKLRQQRPTPMSERRPRSRDAPAALRPTEQADWQRPPQKGRTSRGAECRVGGRQAGKAPDFGSGIRRFESFPPSIRRTTSEAEAAMIENSTQTDGAKGAIKVFAGTSNPALSRDICACLGVPVARADIRRFSDGEINVDIQENVRGGDVFVIQSTSTPGNDHLMELLLMLDALKRASSGRITAVIPYYGYARQDRKVAPRAPISAKLVAALLETAGASRIMTMDLHAGQIQGFFNIPVDNLYAAPVLLRYLRERVGEVPATIISPDAGGVERARAFAKRLDASLAVIDKRRS